MNQQNILSGTELSPPDNFQIAFHLDHVNLDEITKTMVLIIICELSK